jgi:hypothetical protein
MADLTDGFGRTLKPCRNSGPETNRNHAETSMKPSETKADGSKRNRETAPLRGAVAGFATRVGRGSLTGRWKPRPGSCPNIRGGITIERDFPANTRLWLTGWTKTIPGGQFVSLLVDIADKNGRSHQ